MRMPKQDLNRELTTVKKAQEKKARERAKEDEEQKQKDKVAAEAVALKRISHMKCSAVFSADWKASGHGQIATASDVSAFESALLKNGENAFSEPMIVSTFPPMQTDFKNVFEKWEGYFTKHCAKHNITKAVCDFEKKHGLEEFKSAMQKFIPQSHMVKELLPSTQELTDRVVMLGFTKTHSSCQWESHFLGSAIYIFKGKMTFLLMAPESFTLDNLKAFNPGCESVKASSVNNFVDGMCADFQSAHPQMFKDTPQRFVDERWLLVGWGC